MSPTSNDDGPWGSQKPTNGASDKPKQPEQPSGNPWTRPNTSGDQGWGKSSRGSSFNGSHEPPELDEIINRIKELTKNFQPKDQKQVVFLGVFVVFILWMASGIYQVASNQVGVIMRFGAYNRTEQPGLRYHLPSPIEDVLLPVVTSQNEIPVGFRAVVTRGAGEPHMVPKPEESMMLTQDENIINVEFTVFWRISDVSKFLFEIRDPETTIKMAAESVMREVIGQNKLQFALTDGRSQIAEEARLRLQLLMDEYNAGIVVSQINLQTVSVPDEVKAAFQDVVNARLDQERFQNQAAAHANKVIPDAKGQAAQLIQQGMAYRDQKTAVAEGDAQRFKEVLSAYNLSRDVTTKRLYLETMESVLKDAHKIIIDKGGSGAIPYLPLDQMTKPHAEKASKGDAQ